MDRERQTFCLTHYSGQLDLRSFLLRKRSKWTDPGGGRVICMLFAFLVWESKGQVFAFLRGLGDVGRVLAAAVMLGLVVCLLRVAHDVLLLIAEAMNARSSEAERTASGLSPVEW